MNIQGINTSVPNIPTQKTTSQSDNSEALRQAQQAKSQASGASTTQQSVNQTEKAETTREELKDAVKAVNDFLKPINNGIQFNLDDDSGKTIVKVVDLGTKEILRQFPSEEMLTIAKAIDKMKGLLVQQKA